MTKTPEIIVINGPNLDRLGARQPEIYGNLSLGDIDKICTDEAKALGLACRLVQSASEAEIVETIHKAIDDKLAAIVINAGALTHTSVAIRDALSMAQMPIVEVHISNIFAREEFRHHSYISGIATGIIAGFGAQSYRLAINAISAYL